jgi:hypothetical protein
MLLFIHTIANLYIKSSYILSNLSFTHIAKRTHTQEYINFSIENKALFSVEIPNVLIIYWKIYYNINTRDIIVDNMECTQDTQFSWNFSKEDIIRY